MGRKKKQQLPKTDYERFMLQEIPQLNQSHELFSSFLFPVYVRSKNLYGYVIPQELLDLINGKIAAVAYDDMTVLTSKILNYIIPGKFVETGKVIKTTGMIPTEGIYAPDDITWDNVIHWYAIDTFCPIITNDGYIQYKTTTTHRVTRVPVHNVSSDVIRVNLIDDADPCSMPIVMEVSNGQLADIIEGWWMGVGKQVIESTLLYNKIVMQQNLISSRRLYELGTINKFIPEGVLDAD